jgi:hypothetical protein
MKPGRGSMVARPPAIAGVVLLALAPLGLAAQARAADAGAAPPARSIDLKSLVPKKTPESVDSLTAKIAAGDDSGATLCDLAELGNGGRAAGPAVVKLLARDDWSTRVHAARTLGYIGYAGAVTPLVAALRSDGDWQLVFTSAESLGRLKDAAAVDALRAVEQRHWFPPVREAARKAQAAIAGRETYPAAGGDLFALEFFGYANAGNDVPACRANRKRDKGSFGPDQDVRRARARSITYDALEVGVAGGRNPPGWEKPVPPKKQKPDAALSIDGGWLLGADRGDQGGELVAVDAAGHATLIRDGNVQAIARLGARVVALGGQWFIGTNSGVAYEVVRDATGRWSARPWRVLPGMPLGSATQPDGSWLIQTNGGSVVLAADGTLTMARCAPAKK